MRFLGLSIVNIHRQLLACIHKFNRLIYIDDTGVGPETLDDQAADCSTEPTGFFKIPPHGETHDKDLKRKGCLEAATIRSKQGYPVQGAFHPDLIFDLSP